MKQHGWTKTYHTYLRRAQRTESIQATGPFFYGWRSRHYAFLTKPQPSLDVESGEAQLHPLHV